MKRIYFDNAATTCTDKEVVKAMEPYFTKAYGNASSLHSFGQEARKALEDSRKKAAELINAKPNEIYFTSGGTESDNLALKGVAYANKSKGKHIITSKIEHHAIEHTCHYLEKQGFEVTYLPVDKYGTVSLESVKSAIRKDTILISIMHANNEIGTIEPIKEIGKIAKEKGILFHTDAVQTFGKVPIDVKDMNIDLLSASSHKLHGPKGVGLIYIREGVKVEQQMQGGGHERGMRSGTENITGIVGFAKACELAKASMEKEAKKVAAMRDRLVKEILKTEDAYLNGHPTQRLPGNAHFRFSFIEGESLLLRLDDKGIAASTGSACSSKSLEPSHVLLAIGLKPEVAHGSLRITIEKDNTEEEIDYAIAEIPKVVADLRKMSPFKKGE
jgi:cysteine desulfurase